MDLAQLSTKQLAAKLIEENERFADALNQNASFDELKAIRLGIRTVQCELQRRPEH